jgi:plastocyanin
MEVEQPKPSRLFLVSIGVIAILLVGLVASVLVFRLQPALGVGCGSGNCTPLAGTVVTIPAGTVTDQGTFSPKVLTVVIGINNTVIFQNLDAVNHTVTSLNGTFDSGPLATGKTWNYTFSTPGTFDYHCIYHPWMTGTVIVKQNPAGNLVSVVTIPPGTAEQSLDYSPSTFIVIIGVNNTVKFVNDDSATHTVTSSDGNFSSGDIDPGQVWVHVFNTPGTFTFHCIYHGWMKGTITVVRASG